MSNYSQSILDILRRIESKKIKDIEDGIECLNNIYENEIARAEITSNSEEDLKKDKKKICDGNVTWNKMLNHCHQMLVDNTEKPPKSKEARKIGMLQSSCCRLISQTIQYASTSTTVYIKLPNLMTTMISILNKHLFKFCHPEYIKMLVEVLSNRLYRIQMLYEHWQELLRICVKFYENSEKEDKPVILLALQKIVHHGSLQSNLQHDIKMMLPFLKNVFSDISINSAIVSERAYQLTCTVIEHIGTECRQSLCEFSESFTTSLIFSDGPEIKFKLLLYFVVLHHPNGALMHEDLSYCFNKENWRKTMIAIRNLVFKEKKIVIHSPSFIALAVEVSKQIIEDALYREEEISQNEPENSQRIKRRRVSLDFQTPIDLLNYDFDIKNRWSNIQILTAMFEKYPRMLLDNDFPAFLKILTELFSDSIQNEKVMNMLCKLGTVMIKIEMEFFCNSLNFGSNRQYWDKIWDTLLKILGMSHNEIEGHRLLQLLIEFRGVQNVNAFVNLYFTDAIRWSRYSVQTLLVLVRNVTISDEIEANSRSEESDKKRLLRWIFNGTSNHVVDESTVNNICEIVTILVSKIYIKQNYTENSKHNKISKERAQYSDLNEFEKKTLENIEKCAMSQAFELDLFIDKNSKVDVEERKSSITYFCDESLDFVLQILISTNEQLLANSEDKSLEIQKLTIVAKFASNLIELNIERHDKRLRKLLDFFQISLSELFEKIIDGNLLDRQNIHINNLLRSFITFYETKYQTKIAEKIQKLFPGIMLTQLFDMFNEEIETVVESKKLQKLGIQFYENIFENLELHKSSKDRQRRSHFIDGWKDLKITIGVHRLLTLICTFDTGKEISERETKVLQNLIQIDFYDSNEIGNLWKALTLLNRFKKCRKKYFSSKIIEEIVHFIEKLFQNWQKDSHGINGILEVIPEFVDHIKNSNNSDVRDFLRILQDINLKLIKGDFGPSSQVKFLKCLHETMKIYPSVPYKMIGRESLIDYLESPFYIVRLEAVNVLHLTFACNNIDVEEKKNLFNKMINMFKTFFQVNGTLEGSRRLDEIFSRIPSALYMLGCVIHASGIFQSKALNEMVILSVQKVQDHKAIDKILNSIFKNPEDRINLVENNLYHLLRSWIEQDIPLDNFPWSLTKCETQVSFYETYIGIILLIKLETSELESVEKHCENLGISFTNVIEDNLPAMLSWLLSAISEKNKFALKVFRRLENNNAEFTNMKVFKVLLNEKLDMIFVDLLQRLHDEKHFENKFEMSISFPEMVVPNFSEKTIRQALIYLNNIATENSLIKLIVSERPNVTQRILSTLLMNIYNQKMLEYKLKAFYHYSYFCEILINEISTDFFEEMATFTLREICYSLIYLIKEEISQLSEISAKFLLYILEKSLPTRSKEISGILNFITKSLIPIVQSNKMKISIKILNFLIIDSKDLLKDSIKKLDAFPSESDFDELKKVWNSLKDSEESNWDLKKQIEHFLDTFNEESLSYSLEGLIHLKNELSNRREEIKQMYKDLEKLRGFTEDCISSSLHKLIYRLIKLTESPDVNISLEAAKCLGQLGPLDLTTMILHPEEGHVKEHFETLITLTIKIITKLVDFLTEKNIKLRQASAEALYEIYSSLWGQKLIGINKGNDQQLGNYNDIISLLNQTRPFYLKSKPKSRKVSLNYEKIQNVINEENDLWIGEKERCYTKWIQNLTCKILHCFVNFYSKTLIQVCKLNYEICEMILPRLIYLIYETDKRILSKICTSINRFFGEFYKNTCILEQTMATNAFKKVDNFSHESVRSMLNIVNFMRIQSENNFQTELNYLHIAKAAQYCSAYFTSVLYAELSSETLRKELGSTPDNISIIDYLCETKPDEGKLLQDILRQAFVKIGDPDSIHGCGLSHLKDQSSRIQHYIQFKQWNKVLIAQDVELSTGYPLYRGIASTFQNAGLYHSLNRLTLTVKKDTENLDEYFYDSAWRLSDWSVFRRQENPQNISNDDYNYYHYQSLKSLMERDFPGLENAIEQARISVINSLKNISLECSKTVYPNLLKLQMLREVEELGKINPENWDEIISHWGQQDLENMNDFSYVEPILSQRIVMFSSNNNSIEMSSGIKTSLVESHLQLSRIAEEQDYPHIAARALESLGRQGNLTDEVKDKLNYQESLLAWTRGDQDIARYLLRNLINKPSLNQRLRGQSLKLFGNWVAEMKSETRQNVIDKYYNKSIAIFEEINNKNEDDNANLNDAYAALATFADGQYQEISEFMKGPLFESLRETAKYANEESYNVKNEANKKIQAAMVANRNENKCDAAECVKIQNEQSTYLQLAVENFLKALIHGEKNNYLIFRLTSLWFKNMSHTALNDLLDKKLSEVSSHKFIPLIPQLAPHVSTELNNFTTKINTLLERCALDHPHHVLPVLFALKNRKKDREYNTIDESKSEPLRPCVEGANALIDRIYRSKIRATISEIKTISDALIDFAYSDGGKNIYNKIPNNFGILKIKNYANSMVPTMTLDVKPNGNYNNIIGIHKYIDGFQNLGGINAPKKICCVGLDGIQRSQVLKVDNDIKNDEVMQQVFVAVNSIFNSSKKTKKRKLNIRTYKVVPLSQKSGVLQWCDNTAPVFNILLGDRKNVGLQKKYYPSDWDYGKCREKIDAARPSTNEKKLEVFMDCCKHFHPVFQHFFTENFPSPETWFERRLAYIRSVATTSMVGYILGLGDRHFKNILLDQTTAELIHIDFGIAVEQGKALPIPETVPFRLTRNMEAAMGVSGVEGVLRRSCEETMIVLRARRDMINTLLQVLLYDPLFTWTVSPQKAHEMQGERIDRNQNDGRQDVKKSKEKAKKALLRIEQKLLGTEEGAATSISGQVERLIQQARDPANLSLIYCGWMAYI